MRLIVAIAVLLCALPIATAETTSHREDLELIRELVSEALLPDCASVDTEDHWARIQITPSSGAWV